MLILNSSFIKFSILALNDREEEQVDNEVNNFNSTKNKSPIKPENKTCIKAEDETLQPLFACEVKECTACFTTQLDLKVSYIHLPTYFPVH